MKKELLFVAASGALSVVLSVVGLAPAAEKFPSKPVNYVVPLEPGAGGDIGARAIVAKATPFMGQPIVVVNKPGGGSTIGYRVTTHVVIGPPKMPKDIAAKVTQVFAKAANDSEFQNFLIERNAIPGWMTPEQTMKHLDEQRSINRSVMEKAGILKEK